MSSNRVAKDIGSGQEVLRLIQTPTNDFHPVRKRLRERTTASALIEAWKLAEDDSTVEALCDLFGYRKVKASVPLLMSALKSKNPSVRGSAAEALGTLKAESAGPALLEALKQEKSPGIRHLLAASLGATATSLRFHALSPCSKATI